MAQGLTLEQLQGQVTVALEQVLHRASGQPRFDTTHRLLWHSRDGRRLISMIRAAASRRALRTLAVRAAAAAKGPEPTGFNDSVTDSEPALTAAQQQTIKDLLSLWGYTPDGIARVLQEMSTVLNVERLAEVLRENAGGGGALDENAAQSDGVGASADRGGFRPPRMSDGLRLLVRDGIMTPQDAEVEAACQQAESSGRRGGARKLDLRMHPGRNPLERAMSLVRSGDPKITYDACWTQACELLRKARADGTEILG